tara:strand:+ start:233 stop:631 length:399 start_codon:yes stop_codon:yes gene_type:complete
LTNWIQPAWDLYTPRGANQNTQFTGLPNTSTSFAYGRPHDLFAKKIQFPVGTNSNVDYSNTRPTSITPANHTTGTVLRSQTAEHDPRVDNYTADPYALKNMMVQQTSFVNTNGIIIMLASFGLLALVLMRVR